MFFYIYCLDRYAQKVTEANLFRLFLFSVRQRIFEMISEIKNILKITVTKWLPRKKVMVNNLKK